MIEDVSARERESEDVSMWRCEDEQMWRWEDVKMSRCEDEQMWRWADVKMRRCEDEKMWRWEGVREGVKMRRCEDEKMRYRPPLLEEPCAQTLSGKTSAFFSWNFPWDFHGTLIDSSSTERSLIRWSSSIPARPCRICVTWISVVLESAPKAWASSGAEVLDDPKMDRPGGNLKGI